MTHDPTASLPTLEPRSSAEILIVGGGLAGLIAANHAVDAGGRVAVAEARRLGGRATTDRRNGYHLNRGPHALYRDGELAAALTHLGIEVRGAVVDGGAWFGSLDGRRSPLPVGPSALVKSRLISAASKAKLAGVMRRLVNADQADLADTSVDEWVAALAPTEDLRRLLHALVRLSTYNAASALQSADAAAMQMVRAIRSGVLYLDGGWSQIVDALAERAQRRGVSFLDGSVASVRPGARPRATFADGTTMDAGAVVLAAGGPDTADRLLGTAGALRGAAGPPVQAAALDLGSTAAPSATVLLGIDEPLYFSMHSIADLAPADRTLSTVARYLAPDDETPAHEVKRQLQRHAQLAGIDPATVEMERFLARMTVTGGMPMASTGGLRGRPGVEADNGVYIAGDWVGPTGILADAAAASARVAADMATARARATSAAA